jgi:DNA-binding transcriptional MerR regulator
MYVQFSEILGVEDRSHLIGELAERFGVTLRTIRFYEQRGLLSPERTDPHTRVYTSEDVSRLGFIVSCRRLGLAIDPISQLLAARDRESTETFRKTLKTTLAAHRLSLETSLADLENQRNYVSGWLDQLEDTV